MSLRTDVKYDFFAPVKKEHTGVAAQKIARAEEGAEFI